MKDSISKTCMKGYEWPDKFDSFKQTFTSLQDIINVNEFNKAINLFNKNEDVILSLLSSEYLGLGKIWLDKLKSLKIKQVFVIAADYETKLFLDSRNISNCLAILKNFNDNSETYISKTGFTEKGLAITALKYPIVKLILELGYNTLLADIDALILKKLPKKYFKNVDVAFQRVVYFPKPIVEKWGFAACTGFIWFRSNINTLRLIKDAIKLQKQIFDDQVALNVALWNCKILWNQEIRKSDTLDHFKMQEDKIIDGYSNSRKINVRALSPKLFWRNKIIPFDISEVIVFHPNSQKTENDKIQIFYEHGIR